MALATITERERIIIMKVRELTRVWLEQENERQHRTRTIARMLERDMGDRDVSMDELVDAGMGYYQSMGPGQVALQLATDESIAIYTLLRSLE